MNQPFLGSCLSVPISSSPMLLVDSFGVSAIFKPRWFPGCDERKGSDYTAKKSQNCVNNRPQNCFQCKAGVTEGRLTMLVLDSTYRKCQGFGVSFNATCYVTKQFRGDVTGHLIKLLEAGNLLIYLIVLLREIQ